MEPNFIVVKGPDPLAILVDAFPEVQGLEDPEDGPYYVYSRFAEYLAALPQEEQLWLRACSFFETLAKGGSALEYLLADMFEGLCADPVVVQRLRRNLGPASRTIFNNVCPQG